MYPELSGFLIQSCKYRNSQQILLHCSKSWVEELPRAALRAVGWAGRAYVAVQRMLQGGHTAASPDTDGLHTDLCLVCSLPPRVQRKMRCCWSLEGQEDWCSLGAHCPDHQFSEASNQVAHLTVSGTCPNFPKPVPDTFPHTCFSLITPQDLVTFECSLLSQSLSLTLVPSSLVFLHRLLSSLLVLCSGPTKSSSESSLSSVTAFLSLAKLHFENSINIQ